MDEAVHKPGACPVDAMLRRISGPWTTYILWLLRTHGILRYGELKRLIPDISPKVLADRLKRLEADGLVARDYQPTIPPTVSYSLTARGVQLKAMLDALGETAMRWQKEDESRASQKRGAAKAVRQLSSAIASKLPRASSSASRRPSATPK
ncbi:MAG: helix-turn-helix transcriptional regulator [Hyphomicrobiales bacterium]|nr:helix-turn-helix transcriptional regulator [Hyphomicrobiales bacterium]